MTYGRIDLSLTNYHRYASARFLHTIDLAALKEIYYSYCDYKNFTSVIPFFEDDYLLPNRDIIGYYASEKLVAYTLMIKHKKENSVISEQFAWNYNDPRLRLGIKSIENECYIYKLLGYKYLYLGQHTEYKSKFDGYEIVGPNRQATTSL